MDANTLTTIISNLGFPVVVCIYMIYVNQKQAEAHKEEVSKMTQAITDLKIAVTSLVEKLTD